MYVLHILTRSRSIVVDHLRRRRAECKSSNIGIASIYLKYNDPEQTLDNILASVLKQLAQDHESVPKPLQELYERHNDYGTLSSLNELSEALLSLIEMFAEV